MLVYLADRADDDGTAAYPKIATIVNVTELSERTVRTALKTLQERGFIRRGDQRYARLGKGGRNRLPQYCQIVWDLAVESDPSTLEWIKETHTAEHDPKTMGNTVDPAASTIMDIIELRGDIQLDKIALLSRALNLKGLNSLAALSSNADTYESYKHFNDFPDMNPGAISQHIRQMMENLHNHMGSGSLFGDFFGMPGDSTTTNNMPGGFPFGHFLPDEFFNPGEGMTDEDFEEFFKNGNHRQKVEKFFQSFGNGTGMSSNSVQITEENGKTKIKIDSQNSDMTYIIDGQQAPKDNVQMPDKILNVNIIPSKEDVKKSYLFITSRDRLGEFVSFQNGVLTFKYNSQEYKYNLEKMKEPLLVIDGRLADRFDIDPSEILQIRPISPIEKEVGYYPNAEVIINTK